MTVKISNSGHDENGRYRYGKAGDQTGTEWHIISNYDRPWYCMLRLKNKNAADIFCTLAIEAAENPLVGYDQSQRTTFWLQLRKSGYRPKNIKTACEADCSAGVMSLLKAVGYILNIDELKNLPITSTHYMRSILLATGLFDIFTSSDYTSAKSEYLRKGDILLKDDAHVATVVSDGANSKISPGGDKTKALYKITCGTLNVRDKRSTKTGKVVGTLNRGDRVYLKDVMKNKAGNTWGEIASGKHAGKYIAVIFKCNQYAKKV